MKKYLIYANTGLSSKQVGLTAEYIQNCKLDNIALKIVMCDNVLENCYFNPLHNSIACASCQSRSMQLLKQIGISPKDIINLEKNIIDINIPVFNNRNEILDYNYEGINIGRGVASSIISYYRDYHLSTDKYKDIIELELKKSINVLHNFKKIINKEKPYKVVFFNGRFSEIYPLYDYCTQNNINYTSIEGGANNGYELYDNSLPQSIKYRHKSTLELWEKEKNIEKKKEIAHTWFKKKRNRDDSIERSFTKNQELNSLPKNFDPNKTNILILNSSEDEVKTIEEFQTDLYDTQNEAINKIVAHFSKNTNFHIYLRVHPNLGKVKNIQIEEIGKMKSNNLTIIGPNENIDTYAIIDNCDKTIVFGSTTGIEATYWGNASILLGKSYYFYLENTCYKPQSFEALYELLKTKDLKAKSQEACLPYGYYYSTYGVQTQHFNYDGLNNSTFKGKKMRKWYFSSFFYLFRYILKPNKWKKAYKAVTGNSLKMSDILRFKI